LVVPVAHIWYFKSLPNKIGYLLGLPSKKLDMIIYYERYVVIQPGEAKNAEGEPVNKMDFLTEEEYLAIMETLPADNQFLEDSDERKFIAKMGAEAIHDLLAGLDLDDLSYELRNRANTDIDEMSQATFWLSQPHRAMSTFREPVIFVTFFLPLVLIYLKHDDKKNYLMASIAGFALGLSKSDLLRVISVVLILYLKL